MLTDQPLKQILTKPGSSGRLVKWAIELSEFDLHYIPRTATKGQVLADFLVEMQTPITLEEAENSGEAHWELRADGSATTAGSGAGLMLTSPGGARLEYALRFNFPATNNASEYEAIIAGTRLAKQLGAKRLHVYTDSQLVAEQIAGTYEAKDATMARYLAKVKSLQSQFNYYVVEHVPRAENAMADALSKLASSSVAGAAKTIFFEELNRPSTEEAEVLVLEEGDDWMTPITKFLSSGILPEDRKEAEKLKRRSARFLLVDGRLYRKSFSGPYLRCVRPALAQKILEEIHEGVCSNHIGGRTLAQKVFRQGYYWPTVLRDCMGYVGRCQKCQEYAKTHHIPAEPLTNITAPWPFVQWGIDIVGPLPTAIRQKKFLIVAIDYFTKWVEAESTATITGKVVQKFLEASIISRFGIPRILISDNGKQFDSSEVREYCEMLHIRHNFTSVYHPQANGQVENANRTILDGLKKRLEGAAGNWVDVLPSVLWAYRTTHRAATGETPFSLTYGTEAVVPVEIGEPSLRVEHYDEATNNTRLQTNLDLLDEAREIAFVRAEAYRRKVAQYHNGRVRTRSFQKNDLVLRKIQSPGHKLGPNWEGPYQIEEVIGHGAYILKDLNGKLLPRAWNICNLRKFYQ